MKKLLIIATCVVAAMAAQAQGTVSFANTSTTKVKFENGTDVAVNAFKVGLYYLNGANYEAVTLVPATGGTHPVSISPFAGRFNGGTLTLQGIGNGATATFQVRAWSASASTYEAALADPAAFIGESASFQLTLGGPGSVPPATLVPGPFTGITNVRPVPEPSIVALGLLGAAALLIRRRN